ncbi:MAG: hypothetical protein V1918_06980 [Planctomycetota bacterium]
MTGGSVPLDKSTESPVPSTAWACVALAAVAMVPFAAGLEVPVMAKRSFFLTPFDPLVWLAAGWLLLAWWRKGVLRARLWDHVLATGPALVLLGWAVFSALWADFSRPQSRLLYGKATIQWIEYLGLGVLVFRALLADEKWRRWAVEVLCLVGVSTVASVLYTSWLSPEGLPYAAKGWLLNRNTYGLFLVFWGPVLLSHRTLPHRISLGTQGVAALILVLLGFLLCWAGGPFLGACVACTATLAGVAKRAAVPVFLALLMALLILSPRQLEILVDSVQVYVHWRDPETGAVTREHTMRYYRWSADLEMLVDHPWLGVGLEQYGRRIHEYYGGIRLPAGRTDQPAFYNVKTEEPLSFGWFFLVAGELGLVGAAILLWIFSDLARSAVERVREGAFGGHAVLGILGGLALAGWFANPMVRGVGGALAFALALAWSKRSCGASGASRSSASGA